MNFFRNLRTHLTSHDSIVLFFTLVLCLSHIHQGTLAVDAIRYAHIAKKILLLNQYFPLVDDLVGEIYTNKPPLLFWILALLFQMFGFNTFIAKLPSVLFAIGGLLLFWKLTARTFGFRTAYWALLLLSLNATFGKDILDLNFEGMMFLGSILCLSATIPNLNEPTHISWKDALLWTLGGTLLLMSKPPYLVFVLLPTALFLALEKKLFRVLLSPAFLQKAVPFALIVAALGIAAGPEYIRQAMDNQVGEPLRLNYTYGENAWRWIVAYGVSFFPLSLIVPIAVFQHRSYFRRLHRREQRDRRILFLLLWLSSLLPVFLLSTSRGRYLFVPLIAGAMLGGVTLDKLFPKVQLRHLQSALLGIAVTLLLIVVVFRVPLHRNNPLVAFVKANPEALSSDTIFCIDGTKDYRSVRETRHAELLMHLEFDVQPHIYQAANLSESKIDAHTTLVLEKRCKSKLLELGTFEKFRKLAKDVRIAP